RLTNLARDRDPRSHEPDLARSSERVRSGCERVRGAEDEPSPPQQQRSRPPRTLRKLDVAAPELDDERLPGRESGHRRGKPVRMDEVRVPCRTARGAREG